MKDELYWIDLIIQADTFKNWINVNLKEVGHSVDNLETDFQDGTKLVALVQVLQKRKLRHNKNPVNQHQEIENITIALDAIVEDGIKLVNIGRIIFLFYKLGLKFGWGNSETYKQYIIFVYCLCKTLSGIQTTSCWKLLKGPCLILLVLPILVPLINYQSLYVNIS